jgi:hypothetical protein
MRVHFIASIVFAAVTASAVDSFAQVLQPPPRSARPIRGLFGAARRAPNPDRPEHQFSVNVDFLGGYEDNVSPEGGIVTDPLAPRQSGTSALFSTSGRYNYGTAVRYVRVDGRGYMNSFRNLDLRPMFGGDVSVNGTTNLGSKAGVTTTASLRYQPTFTLGAINASSPQVLSGGAAPTDPTTGVSEISQSSGDVTSTFTYNWSIRNRTNAAVGYSRQRVQSNLLVQSRSYVASAGHGWDLSRSFGLLFSYQLSNHESRQPGAVARPVESQQAQAGVEFRKSISPTRRMIFNGGAGAMRVETLSFADSVSRPFEYTAPSYFGGVRMDLGRTWAVTADARRDVTVLDGITQQTFLTDMLAVWVGGNIGSSWVAAVSATASQGRPHQGEVGSYESANATAQLQYAVARCCSVFGSYSYYNHRLRDLSTIPAGFPSTFDRNAMNVGVTVWLPLFGSFPAGRPATTGRN